MHFNANCFGPECAEFFKDRDNLYSSSWEGATAVSSQVHSRNASNFPENESVWLPVVILQASGLLAELSSLQYTLIFLVCLIAVALLIARLLQKETIAIAGSLQALPGPRGLPILGSPQLFTSIPMRMLQLIMIITIECFLVNYNLLIINYNYNFIITFSWGDQSDFI